MAFEPSIYPGDRQTLGEIIPNSIESLFGAESRMGKDAPAVACCPQESDQFSKSQPGTTKLEQNQWPGSRIWAIEITWRLCSRRQIVFR